MNIGESFPHEPFGLMGHVQINTVRACALDLTVNSPSNDVARCQRSPWIALPCKVLALGIDQDAALTAYRLTNKERARLRTCRPRVVKTGWMKLDELHIGNRRTCPPPERHPITGRGVRVGGVEIDLATATGSQHHPIRAENLHLARHFLQHIGA